MAASIPSVEPTTAPAGDTWQWTQTYSDYPPSGGWTLTYTVAAGEARKSVDATADDANTGYEVTFAAGDTAALTPGTHKLVGRVRHADGRAFTVYNATLYVTPNYADSEAGDYRSQDERELEVLDAKIAERLAADLSSYSVAGRQVAREELAVLQAQRGALRARIIKARNGGRLPPYPVSFGSGR